MSRDWRTEIEEVAVLPVPGINLSLFCRGCPTRLSLGNDIPSLEDGLNGSLLDGRWLLEPVGIDTSEEIVPIIYYSF